MKVMEIRGAWDLDHLRPARRPDPEPGPGEVLLRLKAASLNYRDLLTVKGGYGAAAGPLPLIPLSDGVGEVVALGEGVAGLAVGDRVCPLFFQGWRAGAPTHEALATSLGGPLDGVAAELMALPADGVARVPDHLSDVEAATLPCAALTAWNAVIGAGGARPGDVVLVEGTGGVALFALQFARMLGATVIVTSKSDEKLERARGLGAAHAINYETVPEWGKAAREWTGGRGVDLVVDVGGERTLPEALRAVRPGGCIAMMGVLSGAQARLPVARVVMRAVRLQGITVGSGADFEAMARAIAAARLRPVVDRVFAFDELRQALDYLAAARHFGKVCLRY